MRVEFGFDGEERRGDAPLMKNQHGERAGHGRDAGPGVRVPPDNERCLTRAAREAAGPPGESGSRAPSEGIDSHFRFLWVLGMNPLP